MNNKKKIFNLLFYIIGIVVLTELDQITKALAEAKLLGKPDFKIIGDAFVFSYLRNSGAAWGMLSGKINLFLVFTVIVMLIVTYVIINLPATRKYMPLLITCTLLVSGAVGNFIDRVRFGYVRGFYGDFASTLSGIQCGRLLCYCFSCTAYNSYSFCL